MKDSSDSLANGLTMKHEDKKDEDGKMSKVVKLKELPPNSIINESFGKSDYIDTYKVPIHNNQNFSIDYITALFFTSLPSWIKNLLSFRNFLVKYFGLKGGDINKLQEPDKSIYYSVGSEAVIFKVHSRNENEIVMADNDKHLNFRTSILIEKTDKGYDYLYSATIVHYNNILGRLYFLPVKPFHKMIIKTMLKIVSEKLKPNE